MQSKDIRWQQRFQNFENAIRYLEDALKIQSPGILEKAGIIQFFELGFELSWNVMKDYLDAQGFNELRSPRDSIKKAFEIDLIRNGHEWLKALDDRNFTSHAYDESITNNIIEKIRGSYFPLLKEFYEHLKKEI